MTFISYFFLLALFVVVFFSLISFLRFAYVHIKAYILRRKFSKLVDSEKKDD